MCLEDYKMLTKIRVRNYVSILRNITKIDTTSDVYNEVKKKLYQLKRLVKYLDLEFDELYSRLEKGTQIYDLETKIPSESKGVSKAPSKAVSRKPSHHEEPAKAEAEEEAKSEGDEAEKDPEAGEGEEAEEKSNEDGEDNENDEDSDDEGYGEEEDEHVADSDDEYEEFFAESQFPNTGRCNFTHELEREELKWQKRADWLEEMLLKIKENSVTKAWIPWFEAKLQQLFDLDVPLKS